MLQVAGQRFEVEPSRVEERREPWETPVGFAARVAADKAREVATRRPGRWVLGADTIVVLGGEALGKPRDHEEAAGMLDRLAGRTHEVVTAFALVDPEGRVFAERAVRTAVTFRELSRIEIDVYAATEEPMDKAGAYAIQGAAGAFVSEVHGSWSNVVGLPLEELREVLVEAGLWVSGGVGADP